MANWYVYIGFFTILLAAFALFYIFHSLEKFSTRCKEDPSFSPVCSKFNGFTASMLMILLIIGGFVITITSTAYILLSAA